MKGPRRRRLKLALGVTLALGAAAAFYLGLTQSTVKLTDGREIAVRSETWGTNHFYVEGKWWLKPVRRFLSVPRATELGLRSYQVVTLDPTLVLWAHCYWPSNMTPTNRFPLLVAAVDATGVSGEPKFQSLAGGNTIPNRPESIAFWRLENFPRRRTEFDVAIYSVDDSGQPHHVGTTRVSNPTPGSFPRWKGVAMPVTNNSNGLELVLVNLVSAPPAAPALRKSHGWFGLWNDALLVLQERGQPTQNWRVTTVEATDATGNRSFYDLPDVAPVGDYLVCGFGGALWPEEPAWKVRFELARIRGFAPSELRELKGLPLPQAGSVSSNALPIDIRGLTGGVLELRRNISPSFPRRNFFVLLNTGPAPRGVRIVLLEATDDLGRKARVLETNPLAPPQCLWGLDVADGASSLNMTFAIQSGQFFDFTVTPRYIGTTSAGGKR